MLGGFVAGEGCFTTCRQPTHAANASRRLKFEVVVRFMDEHLPPSYQRIQHEVWRAELLSYWQHDARRQRT